MNVRDPGAPNPPTGPWQESPTPSSAAGANRHARRQASESEPHDDVLVRPYLVTGGRTFPLQDGLRVETVIHAAPAALHAPLKFELRRIVEICQAPRSVAEIAVGLGIPLGVARVLISDLIVGDFVAMHMHGPDEISIGMLERILDRVRAL